MHEHHETSRALDQGADGRLAVLAHQQVAFPVTRYGSVLDLGRPLADVDHVGNPAAALVGFPPRLAQRPTCTKMNRELTAERASALNVDRLIDGLVRHPHLRVVGELAAQFNSDLARAQSLHQFGLHETAQLEIAAQLGRLRSTGIELGSALGVAGPIVPGFSDTWTMPAPSSIPLVPHIPS